jgi:hypothetical protein
VTAAAVPPRADPPDDADLLAAEHALNALLEALPTVSDAEADRLAARLAQLEASIATAPAATLDGVLVKLRLLRDNEAVTGGWTCPLSEALYRTAIEALEQLQLKRG